MIECYIRKAWISTIGYQFRCPSVVARQAIFPKCPKIDLDIDEKITFKILKESQVIRYPSY